MTDAASALRAAAFCFHFPINLSEIDEGIEWSRPRSRRCRPALHQSRAYGRDARLAAARDGRQ